MTIAAPRLLQRCHHPQKLVSLPLKEIVKSSGAGKLPLNIPQCELKSVHVEKLAQSNVEPTRPVRDTSKRVQGVKSLSRGSGRVSCSLKELQ